MRQDIQCLRGLAIIFVFLYHLYPTIFLNGFLGVDIFFVISGYLMAKNLSKKTLRTPTSFLSFYYKRFRRILPLYYLIILVTLILVTFYLGDFWWPINRRYSLVSLFVWTNMLLISDSSDYFKQFLADEKSPNAFLHLWSLGVEMQFYLIVPFIFLALQILKSPILKFIAVLLTCIIGFIPFILLNPLSAFNFMPLRLWQFAAGFCALYWRKLKSEELPKKEDGPKVMSSMEKEDFVTIGVAILTLCVFPSELDVQVLRPVVTVVTALLIAMEAKDNKVLKTDVLVYIGNISYIIYSVHWPILSMFSIKSNFQCDFLVVVLTLLSSVLLHHLYEKQYLKLNWIQIVSLVSTLILANAFLQYSIGEHHFWGRTYPTELQNLIDANKKLQDNWMSSPSKDPCVEGFGTGWKRSDQDPYAYDFCVFPPGNGSLRIMNIGNSYVKNLNEHIRDHFHYNYSDYKWVSVAAGYGIYEDPVFNTVEFLRKQVRKYKPDVLFITARFSDDIKRPITENDKIFEEIQENIKFYEQHVKKIYILGSLPLFKPNFINHFLTYLIKKPEDLEQLHMNQKLADEERKYAVERLNMVKCEKCKIYDLSPAFVENGKYLTFDRNTNLVYVDNSIHITEPGIKLFEKKFEEIVDEAMNSF